MEQLHVRGLIEHGLERAHLLQAEPVTGRAGPPGDVREAPADHCRRLDRRRPGKLHHSDVGELARSPALIEDGGGEERASVRRQRDAKPRSVRSMR